MSDQNDPALINPGFETGNLTGWTRQGTCNVVTSSDAAWITPHSGSYMLRLGRNSWVEQQVDIKRGTILHITGYAITYNSSRFVTVQILFDGESSSLKLGDFTSGGTQWKQFDMRCVAPRHSATATIRLICPADDIRLDDIAISTDNGDYYPLPETCGVFLNLRRLPTRPDDSDALVPLTPFTISWGLKSPWEESVPNVLEVTLLDQHDYYGGSPSSLVGQRLTVRPDWTSTDYSHVQYAVFDGYITDVSIIDSPGKRNRLKVTASDRMYILRTDVRKGPNTGTDGYAAKGYQWWMQGIVGDTIASWLRYDGIYSYWAPWDCYPTPFDAAERKSFMDMIEMKKTRRSDGKYHLELDRMFYINYQSNDPTIVPSLQAIYGRFTNDTVLTGPRVASDTANDIGNDIRYIDAGDVLIERDAELTGPDEYYTQLEMRYAHRGTSSDGYRKYEFIHDGSRVVQIETITRNGESTLSIPIEWTQYDSDPDSDPTAIDVAPAIDTIRESNRRIRLPEVTLRSDRTSQRLMYCRPQRFIIIGSRFERTAPGTHGAWMTIGGTLTYDARSSGPHWSHRCRLFPITTDVTGEPTCGDMKQLNSAASFSQATWKLGALRYVNKTGDDS